MDNQIIQSRTVARQVPFRGSMKSSDWNDFVTEVAEDTTEMANAINSLHNRLHRSMMVLQAETAHLRRQVDALQNQQNYSEQVAGQQALLVARFLDFSNTEGISFPGDSTYSAMVSAEFGEATLPANAVENKFYVSSLRTGRILPPADLVVQIDGTFDKGEGDGLVDYERGGTLSEGQPTWAFNGNNDLYWIRRVEFPLDSRVDQVECQMRVVVPEGSSREANLIEVMPFPNGSVDLVGLATSSDLGSAYTTVPGFASTDNLKARRYHFPATGVDQIVVRLRQRNWVEENGKKVFYYGLQELGLKLVDYDKRYTPGGALGTNHTFISRFDAPNGYAFNSFYRIDPSPNFLLEDMGKRHVHLRLCSDLAASNVLWDSDSNLPPQRTSNQVSAGSAETLYWIIELNYVDQLGGSLSPYQVGTTPYLQGVGCSFTLQELS